MLHVKLQLISAIQEQAWDNLSTHIEDGPTRSQPLTQIEVRGSMLIPGSCFWQLSFCNYFSNKIIKNMWKHYWVRQWWMTAIQCSFCLSLLFSKVELKKQQEESVMYLKKFQPKTICRAWQDASKSGWLMLLQITSLLSQKGCSSIDKWTAGWTVWLKSYWLIEEHRKVS